MLLSADYILLWASSLPEIAPQHEHTVFADVDLDALVNNQAHELSWPNKSQCMNNDLNPHKHTLDITDSDKAFIRVH